MVISTNVRNAPSVMSASTGKTILKRFALMTNSAAPYHIVFRLDATTQIVSLAVKLVDYQNVDMKITKYAERL